MSAPLSLPTASAGQAARAAWALVTARRRAAVSTAAVLLAAAASGVVVPPLLGRIVDTVVDHGERGRVDGLAAAVLAAVVLGAILNGLATVRVAQVGEAALADLREQVVDRALALPLEDVERNGHGDLVARVSTDVAAVSTAFREAVPELLAAAVTVVLTVVGLTLLDWRLALAALVVVPIHVGATRWYLRRSSPLYAAERILLGRRTAQLTESIGGAATIATFRIGPRHQVLADQASAEAIGRSLAAASVRGRFFTALNGAELVGLATVLVAAFLATRQGVVSVGTAAAAALYFHRLFDPFNRLLGLIDAAQDAGAGLARLVGVASLPERAVPAAAGRPDLVGRPDVVGRPGQERGAVAVEAVDFAYGDGPPVLHQVSLRVEPGSRVALVGPSGAGKTTIARLVAGIHRPAAGTVSVGGHRHDELGPAAAGRAVTLVTQEVHVFACTLAEDLRLADPGATDARLHETLALVGATAWVESLPDGLATVVGEGGFPLGVIEAQQLALARMVLTGAPVVVLDEATAEAGSAGARVLEASVARAVAGRTALVVAHRLSQAATSDRIVVLEDGRVVQTGTHDELTAGDGVYAGLWAAWSAARAPALPGS